MISFLPNQKFYSFIKIFKTIFKIKSLSLLALLISVLNSHIIQASDTEQEIKGEPERKKQKNSNSVVDQTSLETITEYSFKQWLSVKRPNEGEISDLKITKKDVGYILFSFDTKQEDLTLKSTGNIILDKDVKITWHGKNNLFLTACSDIIFEEGSMISHQGKGSLKLQSGYYPTFDWYIKSSENKDFQKYTTSTVIFKDNKPQVDFSQSSGFITIFYNPKQNGNQHKYQNPTDFSKNIIIKKELLKSFMIINQEFDHVKDMSENLTGNYCLNSLFIYHFNGLIFNDLFTGHFLYNSSHINGHFTWSSYPKVEFYFFENALENIWGEQIFNTFPPHKNDCSEIKLWCAILNDNQNFLTLATDNNKTQFDKCNFDYKKFAYINDKDYTTPLHLAAKLGRTSFIKKIISTILDINIDTLESIKIDEQQSKLLSCFLDRKDNNGKTPLLLSTENGHVETAVYLIKIYNKFQWNYEKDRIFKIMLDQQVATVSRFQEIIDFSNSVDKEPKKLTAHWQGFANESEAYTKEYYRQQKASEKFFQKQSTTFRTNKLFDDFMKINKENESVTLNLEGIPSRSRIMLINSITKHKAQYSATRFGKDKGDPCEITCKFVEDHIILKNNPSSKKPGYIYVDGIGAYGDKEESKDTNIDKKIKKIEQHIDSFRISKMLQWSRITGNSITAEVLTGFGYLGQKPREHSQFLNKLCFLLDIEIASRLFRDKDNNSTNHDKLPIACSNVRSYMLQRIKAQTFDQFLSKSSEYHAFTDSGSVAEREQAIRAVNIAYHKNLAEMNINDYRNSQIQEWQKNYPHGVVIATQEGLHQELLAEYGGGYESDGDEYKSDND